MTLKNLTILSADKGAKQLKVSCAPHENAKLYSHSVKEAVSHKLRTHIPSNPATLFLGRNKYYAHTKIFVSVFIATLFIIAKNGNNRCVLE